MYFKTEDIHYKSPLVIDFQSNKNQMFKTCYKDRQFNLQHLQLYGIVLNHNKK